MSMDVVPIIEVDGNVLTVVFDASNIESTNEDGTINRLRMTMYQANLLWRRLKELRRGRRRSLLGNGCEVCGVPVSDAAYHCIKHKITRWDRET